jgi:transposase
VKKVACRVQKVNGESLGLDVHQGMTAYCLLGRNGDEVESGRIGGGRKALEALLDRVIGRKKSHVSLEASGGSLWVYDVLVERYGAERVHIAQARKLAAIANTREKNDANDAFWLAYFTREGRLPEAYIPQGVYRELRVATRERHRTVTAMATDLRIVKGHFRQMGVTAPVKHLNSEKGAAFVRALAATTEGSRGMALRAAVRRLDAAAAEVAEWNDRIAELVKDLPEVKAIEDAIPGMGRVLAATVVAETGPIGRFHSPRALAKYTGLTPSDRSTGGKMIHGGISREGNPSLRWALVQAVTICGRMRWGPGGAVRTWVESRHRRMGSKAKAKVAAAHKLAEAIWRLVHHPEGFDIARPFGGVPAKAKAA